MSLRELIPLVQEDKIPKGWKTAVQWGEEEGMNREQALMYLRMGMKRGIVEKKEFCVRHSKLIRRTPHYRIKK